jgi:23S rRNA pseudouridine1911/1915/1917 synthase
VKVGGQVKRLTLEAGTADAGRTLQALLHERCGLSHSRARGLIDAGGVRLVGGHPIPAGEYGRRLAPGERFEVELDPARRYQPKKKERPGRGYRVVHRDDDILVVDKGPEVLSVPTPLSDEDSLVDRILESERERGVKHASLFPVHRLDRDTSGLLLFARNHRAHVELKASFAERAIERRYLAVVEGRLEQEQGKFESRLVEDPKSLKVKSTTRPGEGREATTEYRVTERLPRATVVTVRLVTGRKNQIRVHFAEARHPLVGDRRYGRPSPHIGRAALHAASLAFRHPADARRMTFASPLPADLRGLLRSLRSRPA